MAKKQQVALDPHSILQNALKKAKREEYESLPPLNVIDFAEGLMKENLRDAQKIVLKFFYMGTRFNEDLDITEEEIELMKSWEIYQHWIFEGESSKVAIAKKNKENKDNWFTDLVLILGRRSGKSYLSALIAVYEAYKLLCLGDPQSFYGLSSALWIINTASTADQAKDIIFAEITRFVNQCPVFEGRIAKQLESTIYIWTDKDLKENERRRSVNPNAKLADGSIVIASGNSNSGALRGKASACVIYDEMAFFMSSDKKSNAEEVYTALQPSTTDLRPFRDGRNIVISSPDKAEGFFYKHYNNAKRMPNMMLFQIASWDANPRNPKSSFDNEFASDPIRAAAEFGARFRTHGGNNFFPFEKIDRAVDKRDDLYLSDKPKPGFHYYIHLDPAQNSDRYAFILAHPEYRFDEDTQKYIMHVVEDYSLALAPEPGKIIDPDDFMDNHVLPLFDKFSIRSVTFDQMFSLEQRKKLKARGINHRQISFGGKMKAEIYTTMRDLFINERIEICKDDGQLVGELKNILYTYTNNGIKIDKNSESDDFPNDDLVDCLGGVIHSMMTGAQGITRLPYARVARLGIR